MKRFALLTESYVFAFKKKVVSKEYVKKRLGEDNRIEQA